MFVKLQSKSNVMKCDEVVICGLCDRPKNISCYCYRTKMGASDENTDSVPQASTGSDGKVTGEVDTGEVIDDSDGETITVGEGMRDG